MVVDPRSIYLESMSYFAKTVTYVKGLDTYPIAAKGVVCFSLRRNTREEILFDHNTQEASHSKPWQPSLLIALWMVHSFRRTFFLIKVDIFGPSKYRIAALCN